MPPQKNIYSQNYTNPRPTPSQQSYPYPQPQVGNTTTFYVPRKNKVETLIKHPIKTVFTCLSLSVIVLSCLLITTTSLLLTLWLRSYRALTQEKIIAKIVVSPIKKDENGNPYFEITYKSQETENALQAWLGIGGSVKEKEQKVELPGDRFRIEADFFRWQNTFTVLGLKPMFKVVRITGDYSEIEDYNLLTHKAIDINGGPDKQWKILKDNANLFSWLGNAYISSAGQDVTYHERIFDLIATEDGLVLKLSQK
jgi:hypothetical protein